MTPGEAMTPSELEAACAALRLELSKWMHSGCAKLPPGECYENLAACLNTRRALANDAGKLILDELLAGEALAKAAQAWREAPDDTTDKLNALADADMALVVAIEEWKRARAARLK